MTDNQDLFADVIHEKKIKDAYEDDKFIIQCKEAAIKMVTEIKTIGSPMYNEVCNTISRDLNGALASSQIPSNIYPYFKTLEKCFEKTENEHNQTQNIRSVIENEFNKISNSVMIKPTYVYNNNNHIGLYLHVTGKP